jgi:hypothetical protein
MIGIEEPMSEELVLDWMWYCYATVGTFLPLNHIEIGEDGEDVLMGHLVPDGKPPVFVPENGPARSILVSYPLVELNGVLKS